MIRCKTITSPIDNKVFLARLSYYFKSGKTLKFHLILRSDKDGMHTHPWNFKSLLIIPYKEEVEGNGMRRYWPLKLVKRNMNEKHRVTLYKLLWLIPIPAITIGLYSEKKQLCSFCKDVGYCKKSKQENN